MFTPTAGQGVTVIEFEAPQSRPLVKALVAVVLVGLAVGLGLTSLL